MIFFPYLCTAIERDCAFMGPLKVRESGLKKQETAKVVEMRK